MIVFENGLYRTVRTANESDKVIKDELSSLTAEEKEALKFLLAEMGSKGDSSILDGLDRYDYKAPLVDMETFVRDEYYLGRTCDVLYDKWLHDLRAIFENRYNEVVFTGSIGSGKSFAASVGICRMLYELSMMSNPHKTFGIAPDSNISIVVFSVNAELAMKVAFENIVSKLQASPYFQENFPFEVTKKELRFPNKVWVAPRATTDTSALGLNVVSAFLDEANFLPMKRAKNKVDTGQDKAEQIYNGLKRRMKSRFQKKGKLPGVLFIVSSKNTRENFTERLIAASKNDPSFWVSDYSTWAVKPQDLYSGVRFHVLVGNEQTPSRILTPEEYQEYTSAPLPDGCVLIDVPEEFKTDFEKDLEGCFTGDTKIAMLDGTEVMIKDLVGRDEFWVYSVGPDGRLYSGRGYDARLTHKDAPIIEVELDNGEKIRCTSNHRFMLRDGTYAEARDLAPGTSLMPLYRKLDRHGYELVKSNVGGKWVHTHRLIAREAHLGGQRIPSDQVIHHRDFNARNNTPENLEPMLEVDHIALHTARLHLTIHSEEAKVKAAEGRRRRWVTDPAHRERVTNQIVEAGRAYNGSDLNRKTAALVGKRFGFGREELTDAQKIAISENGTRTISALNASERNPSKKPENRKASSERMKKQDPAIRRIATMKGLHSRWHKGVEFDLCERCNPAPNNHKVVAVRFAGHEDVYDISVEKYHNFALTAGVYVHNSIRDMAGVATVSISPFIQRREKIVGAVELGRMAYGPMYRHPFTVVEFEPGKPGQFMWDRMVQPSNEKNMFGVVERRNRPIINPRAVRHVHIDPSLNGDATGICMAHISGWKDVIRKAGDGAEYKERAPIYTVDFMLRVIPPVGDEIILADMRQFIYDLSHHGYLISTVTMDGHQSADAIQQLSAKGYTSEKQSVDISMDPYETLKLALYEDRVLMYEYEPVLEELRTIQKDLVRRKIDHPDNGTKDVADALAGCLYTLSLNQHAHPLPIVRVAASDESAWMPELHRTEGSGSGTQTSDVLLPFIVGGGFGTWGSGSGN